MLVLDAFCLAEDLAPSVFARRFDAEHSQIEGRKVRVPVFIDAGEDKIRACSVLSDRVESVAHIQSVEEGDEVVLQSLPCTAFAPVMQGEGDLDEPVHVHVPVTVEGIEGVSG
jgi:hypothetical protein